MLILKIFAIFVIQIMFKIHKMKQLAYKNLIAQTQNIILIQQILVVNVQKIKLKIQIMKINVSGNKIAQKHKNIIRLTTHA